MKHSKGLFFSIFILVFILSLFIISCSDSQLENTAHVTIDLESNGMAFSGEKTGFIDKIMNFVSLSGTAHAAAPSNITSYKLVITADDMQTITEQYSANTKRIEINIPSGKQRRFTLTASINPSDVRAVLAYSGSTTVDLKNGEIKNITLTMVTSETKILIPDSKRVKVVQIDDMKGTNWTELVLSNLQSGIISFTYNPYDISLDAQGRIYIANNSASTSDAGIFRIDSIKGGASAQIIIAGTKTTGIQWISIDMKNAILYFATSSILYSAGLDGSNMKTLATMPSTIYGICVDEEGMVYVVYTNGGGTSIVRKYDPSNFLTPLKTFDTYSYFGSITSAYIPKDVVVKSGKVYIAIAGNILADFGIVQLDSNLQYVDRYGTGTSTIPDTAAGHFYGPSHFVATLNRKLYLIDDGGAGGGFSQQADKLVSMDDIDGTNWETYGSFSFGAGEGYFSFYYGC